MTALSVNVNKVAVLRNSRGGSQPDVVTAAQTCIDAGVDGITVHPRPDMRHIKPHDVYALAEMLTVEYNIEGNPYAGPDGDYPGFMTLIRDVSPTQVTFVPDTDDQLTSDHGWALAAHAGRLRPLIAECKALGCRVSLFMNPEPAEYALARELGADRIELYTEAYARAWGSPDQGESLQHYRLAAKAAQGAGLEVNAGHDLNLDNLGAFLTIEGISEVSIGHAVIADALRFGLHETVCRYRTVMSAT
ncbi:MAG: pyridoxine 5'-phosphate synthase [Gammaproteobacteria bacterium]|nr:pyridoxine 5'-phosphate synthase [Gammaproteobacteria bacterium]MDH3768799.1 pyridoxine 5'-phosphate synthase [Gammaproteobacteria bacterium]